MQQSLHDRGRKRLMLRMPHYRKALESDLSPVVRDICESYELAVIAWKTFSQDENKGHVAREYDEIRAALEHELSIALEPEHPEGLGSGSSRCLDGGQDT